MKDFDLSLELFDCEIGTVDDVATAAGVVFDRGVRFRMLHGERMRAVEQREVISELCRKHFGILRPAKKPSIADEWSVAFPVTLGWFATLNAGFSFTRWRKVSRLALTSLLDFELDDESGYVLPFSQLLRDLVEPLVNECKPQLLRLDSDKRCDRDRKDVPERKLTWLAWVNVFGPDYVEKYGEEFLLGLPGYEKRLLPNGSVFHQISPTVMAANPRAARETRQRVTQYCAKHGLKVDCYAPHKLPSPRSVEAKGVDKLASFAGFLDAYLATTLVVDEKTRLKPIFLDWFTLSDAERAIAQQAIINAVKVELEVHPTQRLRLELNELPESLERDLRSRLGDDNPRVEWAFVKSR